MPIYKTEKKKDGKQQYKVTVNYVDANGKYRQSMKMAYGLSEAKELESKMKIDVAENVQGKSMTVKELYDEYIVYKKHEVRETSLNKSKSVIEHSIIPDIGNMKISKLNNKTLSKWKLDIANKDNIKLTTKRNIYKEFHTMLNYAVKMEYLPKNPLNSIGTFKEVYFETTEDKIHYYTSDQYKKYIAAAKSHTETLNDYGFYVFFALAFYTGMRKGEINALKWSDIEDNIIHVRRSVAQKVKGKSIVETPPKNKSSYRSLQMPLPLKNILDEHKARQQQYKEFSEDWRVCGGIDCLKDSSLTNKNFQFANEANLPHIRIHDFRHSHASLLANEGINIQEIARRLGHSNIEITWNTYSHLYPKEEERAVQILNKIE